MSANTGKAFIYWDNSNIYARAKAEAKRREGPAAADLVRINFGGLLRLACAGRPMERAVVAASVPPSPEVALWERMANLRGVETLKKFNRGDRRGKEQEVPDLRLQNRMLGDALDRLDAPGVAVLLTGDGGFLPALKRMHRVGWRAELLAWTGGCSREMREWAENNGVFAPLDDYYEALTFLKVRRRPGALPKTLRLSAGSDFARRSDFSGGG